jgi:hypothetical protein
LNHARRSRGAELAPEPAENRRIVSVAKGHRVARQSMEALPGVGNRTVQDRVG